MDTLTDSQKIQMAGLLHDVFTEIRRLGRLNEGERVAHLAAVVENIPNEMYGIGVFRWVHLKTMFRSYHEKYPDKQGADFLSRIDNIRMSK